MTTNRMLKLGQIAGALLLAAGVASCQMRSDPRTMSLLFIVGAMLYAGCRLTAWLRRND
jgi:hypothetical protein